MIEITDQIKKLSDSIKEMYAKEIEFLDKIDNLTSDENFDWHSINKNLIIEYIDMLEKDTQHYTKRKTNLLELKELAKSKDADVCILDELVVLLDEIISKIEKNKEVLTSYMENNKLN